MERAAAKAGITRDVSPHWLRYAAVARHRPRHDAARSADNGGSSQHCDDERLPARDAGIVARVDVECGRQSTIG
jgi:hypothetical protein